MSNAITRPALLRAFRQRSFVLLWSGQLLSRLGDFLYQIALAWWVLEATGSATVMATVLIFSFGPTILFTLIGGVAADRLPRLPILVGSDVLRGVIVLVVAALALRGQLALSHIYGLSLCFGLVDAFFHPAYTATVPVLVPEEDLPSANSLSSFAIQAGRIAGPPLGAGLIALGGTGAAFAVNGLTFLISALFLLLIRQPVARPVRTLGENEVAPKLRQELTAGIQLVAATPWLWLSILLFALTNIALAGPYSVGLPFLVNDHWQADAGLLGLFYALFATGYVLGGVWLGRQDRIRHHGRLLFGGVAVASAMLALFGLPVPLIGLGVAALVNGAAMEMGNLAWTHLLQERVPRDMLGRVSSVDVIGSLALMPVGYAVTGWATDLLGAPLLFVISGSAMTLIALLAMQHPVVRELDREETAPVYVTGVRSTEPVT